MDASPDVANVARVQQVDILQLDDPGLSHPVGAGDGILVSTVRTSPVQVEVVGKVTGERTERKKYVLDNLM